MQVGTITAMKRLPLWSAVALVGILGACSYTVHDVVTPPTTTTTTTTTAPPMLPIPDRPPVLDPATGLPLCGEAGATTGCKPSQAACDLLGDHVDWIDYQRRYAIGDLGGVGDCT